MKNLKNNLFEDIDPDEIVDDVILNKRVELDGEERIIFDKLEAVSEDLESDGFVCEMGVTDENIQCSTFKGNKVLVFVYNRNYKLFAARFGLYDDATDSLNIKHERTTKTLIFIDKIIKDYKSYLMKENLQEATKKQHTNGEVETMIKRVCDQLGKLEIAYQQVVHDPSTIKIINAAYRRLFDLPSIETRKAQLKKLATQNSLSNNPPSTVVEDVKIDATASTNVIKKAEEITKKQGDGSDIEIVEEGLTVGKLKAMLRESQQPKKPDNSNNLKNSLLTESEKKNSVNNDRFETYRGAVNKVEEEFEKDGYSFPDHMFWPQRPRPGESARIDTVLYRNGEESDLYVHIQVYNADHPTKRDVEKPYELNYYFSHVNDHHHKIKGKAFNKLIEFLESSLSMFDDADYQHYSDETGLPIEKLMDYYTYYGMNDERISDLKLQKAKPKKIFRESHEIESKPYRYFWEAWKDGKLEKKGKREMSRSEYLEKHGGVNLKTLVDKWNTEGQRPNNQGLVWKYRFISQE